MRFCANSPLVRLVKTTLTEWHNGHLLGESSQNFPLREQILSLRSCFSLVKLRGIQTSMNCMWMKATFVTGEVQATYSSMTIRVLQVNSSKNGNKS